MRAPVAFCLLASILIVGIGCSKPTETVSPPSAPTGTRAIGGNNEVTVSWPPVSDATSYNLYWATKPGGTSKTGNRVTDVASPYTHTGLTNGTTYYYVVVAVNDGGNSPPSDEVFATPVSLPHVGFYVQGTTIYVTGLGECGTSRHPTAGATSMKSVVICNGELHTLDFNNITYRLPPPFDKLESNALPPDLFIRLAVIKGFSAIVDGVSYQKTCNEQTLFGCGGYGECFRCR